MDSATSSANFSLTSFMEISLANFKTRFHDLLTQFLWRQWSALGVAGHATTSDPWMIDPEALLLFSTVAARRDARLFDEIFDWLRTNGSWINLQRLTRLEEEQELGDATILAAIASHLTRDSAHGKWKVLIRASENETPPPRPLFPGLPVLGVQDEAFLRWGWQRGTVNLRGLSQPPRPNQPATFLIKLRSLFGRQSRAEVIAWLLAHDSGHPAEMARQLGYFPRSLQVVLNELTISGHVRAVKTAREKHFALHHEEWRFLLTWAAGESVEFPRWVAWGAIFRVLQRFHDLMDRPDLETMSPHLQAIEIKRAVDVASLVKAGLPAHLTHPPDRTGSDFMEGALRDLESLLG
jgi:hypothetical protein